jgi:hypothetical protein
VALLEQRQQGPHALDRDPRLVEIAHVLGVGSESEPLAPEVDEADDRLEEHVVDGDPAQLFLEAGAHLLVAHLLVIVTLVPVLRVLVAHALPSPHGAASAAPDSA